MDPATNEKPRPWRLALKRILQFLFVLGVVYFAASYLYGQWGQIKHFELRLNGLMLFLAQFVLTLGLGLFPLGSWLIIRGLGKKLALLEIWHSFFLSQMAKYLPGSIWGLPSRAYLYHQHGLETKHSIAAVFWESGLSVTGASIMAVLGLPLLFDSLYLSQVAGVLGVFVGAFLVGSVVLQSSPVRGYLDNLEPQNAFSRMLKNLQLHLPFRYLVLITAFYIIDWLLIGLGFAILVHAFLGSIEASTGYSLAGLFAGAWAVGFLFILTPGGIGVRDAILAIGVSNLVSDPLPLVVAVLARIGWSVAEGIGLLLSMVIYRRARKTTPESLPSQDELKSAV